MRWFRIDGGWRRSGMLLLALAMAVRLAAPTGWMLAPGDGHGAARLVICTGHGLAELAPAGVGHPGKSGDTPDKQGDHVCVFAGHAAPPPPPLIAALLPAQATAFVDLAPSRPTDQRPGRGLAAPPPPSQGPPDLTP
jgi:hypothetical protein